MPLDHSGINVTADKFKEVVEWYAKALAPLGYTKAFEFPVAVGFGDPTVAFIISVKEQDSSPLHFAFKAKDQEEAKAFYDAGLAAGGKDNGAPGIRERVSPNYYAAFVLDPVGNNIEAVIRL